MKHSSEISTTPQPAGSRRPGQPTCVSSVLVKKYAPEQIQAGQEFEYEVVLMNLSDSAIESLVVVETLVSLLELKHSRPSSQIAEEHTGRWVVGPLLPKELAHIHIHCVARQSMRFRSHTSVSFSHGA